MDHFGIGVAIRETANAFFQGARGSGRTTSLVDSVKSGDRIIFHDNREAERVKKLCAERGVEIEWSVVPPAEPEKVFERGSLTGDGRWIVTGKQSDLQTSHCRPKR